VPTGGWTENIIHNFSTTPPDGFSPTSGLIFDQAGNLYGTTVLGGNNGGCGTVFQFTPSGSGWQENILYAFAGSDGCGGYAGLIFDTSGNLYGTTAAGGSNDEGNVFELIASNGNWAFTLLYGFSGIVGLGPTSSLARDAAGNLYGTTYQGGTNICLVQLNGCGNVFRLAPSDGGWTYTDLYDFTGGSDGKYPYGGVIVDASGNLYSTALAGGLGQCNRGGTLGCGVVWEITP
jgi:uncharacterized repeat protein (TIGR03803 family)